jgi:hypothetical protein
MIEKEASIKTKKTSKNRQQNEIKNSFKRKIDLTRKMNKA